MSIKTYATEREGQLDFLDKYLARIDKNKTTEEVLSDNTDGLINGNLLEFKLNITNLSGVLFQCIKYLSSLRLKGKPLPKNIVLISLNDEDAYLYHANDYLSDIEKVYVGAASKNNDSFTGGENYIEKYDYSNALGAEKLISTLKETGHTKIHLDENCVVGWAKYYYSITHAKRKEDFVGDETGEHKVIGEIRKPTVLKEYIYPYTEKTNLQFGYLMDALNDKWLKVDTGAFYTAPQYALKSKELVEKAIARVPKGNDYIILDRCAGTGNLEQCLTDEQLSHCIVSTIEYYEYKVLVERLGDKVRHIIPPVEDKYTFNGGFVTGADALTKEYVDNPVIMSYVNNPKCTIILYENVPYSEGNSIEHQRTKTGKKGSEWKSKFVAEEMKKEIKQNKSILGSASNDMGNAFIWSAFKYYLRQDTDSYIVYSPIKYWKNQHLISKKCIDGLAFNRRHFHTNINACITCLLWSNENSNMASFTVDGYDLDKKGNLTEPQKISINRVDSLYYDKFPEGFNKDAWKTDGVHIGLDGYEKTGDVVYRGQPLYSEDMLGYMIACGATFDNPDTKSGLLRAKQYNANGLYLHKDTYLEKLPLFASTRYITYNREWTERARIMKSGDKADEFKRDIKNGKLTDYLYKCLIFALFVRQNHMVSFKGSDGRYYRNELCLDTTHGETQASKDLKKYTMNDKEKAMKAQWDTILELAKKCKNYNKDLTYGLYQIANELDTFVKNETTGKRDYDYLELHTALDGMATMVKEYYQEEIVPTLFEYELLK